MIRIEGLLLSLFALPIGLILSGIIAYFIQPNHSNPKPYGITEMQLTGHLDQKMEERILQIPNVEKIHIENEVMGNIEYQGATFLQSFYPLTEDSTEYFAIPAEGNNTYSYLSENDAILIVNSNFCEKVIGVNFKPGEKITLHYYDGEEHSIELEIGAVSDEAVASNTERSNFCMSDSTMRKLWAAMNTASSFTVSINDYEKNGEYVEKSIRTILQDYEDLSLWTLREQKLEDAGTVQTVKVQIYGLSAFVIVFSIFNLISLNHKSCGMEHF